MLHGVHQGPSLFMACTDAGRVAAGERLRTGVNEPRTEPTRCHGAWPIGRVPGAVVWVGAISWALSPAQGALGCVRSVPAPRCGSATSGRLLRPHPPTADGR